MECVQSHLRCWFTNRLSSEHTNHFSGIDFCPVKACFYLADGPVQGGFGQPILFQHTLACQHAPDENPVQSGRVVLCLDAQGVVSHDHAETIQELPDPGNDRFRVQVRGLAAIDLKLPESVLDDALHVTGCIGTLVGLPAGFSVGHDDPQNGLVFPQYVCFFVQQELDLGIRSALLHDVGFHKGYVLLVETKVTSGGVQHVTIFELLLGQCQRIEVLSLDPDRIHAIFSVQELDDLATRGSHGPVVPSHHRFHGFHQTALDVSGFCRLAGGIDQTLSTTHGMEEKFLRGQPAKVAVFHESTRLGSEIVLRKMGEGSFFESVGNPLSLHVLLSDAGDDLRNVDKGTLRSRRHHGLHGVCLVQGTLRGFSGVVTRRVQDLVHELFEGFHHGPSRLDFEVSLLSELALADQIQNLQLGLVDRCLDLFHCRHIGHRITGTDAERRLQDPVVDELLDLVHESCRLFVALVEP
mmetsp:Transcript_115295/g.235680  ORF Transcript_115295/g.235680 Transcript_115295/m.235680 type:complete len:467 (+) Transcript_115295:4900-6300(+)